MRASSVVIGFGCAVLALGLAGVFGLAPWPQFYAAAAGLGLGMAASEAAGLVAWWRSEMSLIENRKALTGATLIANQERARALAAPVLPVADPKLQAKSLAVETFLRAGDKAGGFSEGKLAGCVGSDHGPWLRHFYISPAGGEWLRDAGGNVGTIWNHGRTLDGALRALRAGELPLPPGPVPDVRPLPDSAAQRRTPQKSAAQPVIEHEAAA